MYSTEAIVLARMTRIYLVVLLVLVKIVVADAARRAMPLAMLVSPERSKVALASTHGHTRRKPKGYWLHQLHPYGVACDAA
jgi:hypothetical protein